MEEKKKKQYVSDNAQLMAEWNWEKNTASGIDPHKLTVGSERKVWWECSKGHEWEAVCYSRTAGNQCPICSGRQVLVGFNDLQTINPTLAAQWHPTLNLDLTPGKITAGSRKKVWWLGSCGHEWEAPVTERTRGRGCPICKSKKVVEGINDLATQYPLVAREWHPSKNKNKPTQVLSKSNKLVWWICSKGHEYKMSPAHRISKKSNCPICSNKQVLVGFNDLATTHPHIAKQWHPTKNELTAQQVTIGAEKNVWWICEQGHEWKALVYSRRHNGCPYCSGNMVLPGYNDLATTNPELAAQWHPCRNKELTPQDVSAGSNQKVWWLGKCGHEWSAAIHSRSSGCGCPICNEERKTSFPENAFFFYIKSIYSDAIKSYKPAWLTHMEIDIYIPSLQIGVEYDGQAWHNDIENDILKGNFCKEHGIRLIRIREPKCPELECECVKLNSVNTVELESAIRTLFEDFLLVANNIDINIERDRSQIYDMISHTQKSSSLLAINPHLAKEWHPTLNGSLKPEHVAFKSNKKVWWKCDNGHVWQDSCNHRSLGRNCPYCSNRRVLAGFNDLQTTNPALSAQWHPALNEDLTPDKITAGSSKKVWWLCNLCGHEWRTTVASRNSGCGCPECYKQNYKKK